MGFGLQNKSIDNFFDLNIDASFIVKNQVANSHLPRLCKSTQLGTNVGRKPLLRTHQVWVGTFSTALSAASTVALS